jgi:transcriptional regulator with XRE-family HTH domain
MSSDKLPNYLRSNRKRLGLSQDQVAFLLGAQSGEKVCRYERFARMPPLQTALSYEVICQRPARELFAGLYQKLEKEVQARAKVLTYKTNSQASHSKTAHGRQALMKIAASHSKTSQNQS